MKSALLLFTMLGIASGVGVLYSQNPKNKQVPNGCFELSAKLEKETTIVGEPVHLQLSLKNITDHTCGVVRTSPTSYSLSVKTESGDDVKMTASYEKLTRNGITAAASTYIPPKEDQVESFIVDKLFQIDRPGVYFIVGSRKISTDKKKNSVTIYSNKVKLTIVK